MSSSGCSVEMYLVAELLALVHKELDPLASFQHLLNVVHHDVAYLVNLQAQRPFTAAGGSSWLTLLCCPLGCACTYASAYCQACASDCIYGRTCATRDAVSTRPTFFCTAATFVSSSGCSVQNSMWNLSLGLQEYAVSGSKCLREINEASLMLMHAQYVPLRRLANCICGSCQASGTPSSVQVTVCMSEASQRHQRVGQPVKALM